MNSYYIFLFIFFFQSSPDVVKQAITVAIDVGYRHIDTAAIYDNEKEIGDALQEAYKAGKVKREELFIVTKVCRTFCVSFFIQTSSNSSL